LIAREKAGIIRPGALVISAPQVQEAMDMIEEVCQGHRARLVEIGRDNNWEMGEFTLDSQSFTMGGQQYWLPLIGEHQVVNAITAITAIQGLGELTDLQVSPQAMRAGVANVDWRGRLEILNHRPYLVVDSAMNGNSAEKLVQALTQYFPGRNIIVVFGASADHPLSDMLKVVLPVAKETFATASIHPRAEKPKNLATLAASLGHQATPVPNVPAALEQALAIANQDDVVCATGSLFLVGDVREAWMRRTNLELPPIDPVIL
jgi:dihydrofolate synthase/folylpolyglutamate synthase